MLNETLDPIAAIERLIERGEDAYQDIVALAMSSEGDMATRRWLIGDLALLVKSEYGKNRVADFATKANLARSTVSQYKNMSAFYPSDVRFVYENLTYSHFRIAYRFKENALEFLAEACYSSWTIEQAQVKAQERLGKAAPPMKLLDAEGCIESVDMMKGTILLSLADGWDISMLDGLQGREVKVKIYEVE